MRFGRNDDAVPDFAPAADVALVTGAAVRIGRAIALELASRGHAVAIHCRTSVEQAEQTAADCRERGAADVAIVRGDLAVAADCRRIVAETADRLGHPTVLVNSAAIFEADSLATMTDESWSRHQAINLVAPLRLMQAVCTGRDERQSVINIVDWRAERPPPGHLSYTLSKAGLTAATELLAQELAPRVRVNGIAPGPMLPPPGEDDSYLDRVAATIPLRRAGSAEAIAHAVGYLLDADFVTGHILHVTGGQEFQGRSEG